MKVYVLLKEGEIEGVYNDKELAQSIKNSYLLTSNQSHFDIEEHEFLKNEKYHNCLGCCYSKILSNIAAIGCDLYCNIHEKYVEDNNCCDKYSEGE